MVIGAVGGVLILGVILGVTIWRRLHNVAANAPRFSVKYTWPHNEKVASTWFVRDAQISKIYCALLANFTNLGPPILIDSYIIKQECPDGSLEIVSLPHGIYGGIIFMGRDKKAVTKIAFDTLDAAIANKNIGSNETVRGWVFITKMHTARLIFQVIDAMGNVFEDSFHGKASVGWPVQPMGMEVTKDKLDISALKEV